MRESALLARSFKGQGVRLHTHLAENDHDIAYSREKFNCTPTEYAQDLGWLGPDVWHAHCVKLDDAGISLFAASRTGVAHCPCSNMRLASGIAPVRRMLDAGVPVGPGRGRQCQQRRRPHGQRGAPGDAAGPRGPRAAAAGSPHRCRWRRAAASSAATWARLK